MVYHPVFNITPTSTSLCDLGKYRRHAHLTPMPSPPPPVGAAFISPYFSLSDAALSSLSQLFTKVFPKLQISVFTAHITNVDPHTMLPNLLRSKHVPQFILVLSFHLCCRSIHNYNQFKKY